MYKRKLSAEEALETIKLRMNYDSSKTLNENVNVIEEQNIAKDVDFIKRELDATFNTDEEAIVNVLKKYKTKGSFNNLISQFKKITGGDFGAYMGKSFSQGRDAQEWADLEKHLKGLGISLGSSQYKATGNNLANKLTFGGVGAPSVADGGGGDSSSSKSTVPTELKSVTDFQDWLDKTHPGWHDQYKTLGKDATKGYGKFGPRTSKAWATYKDEYLKGGNTPTVTPTPTGNPDLEVDDKDAGFDQPF